MSARYYIYRNLHKKCWSLRHKGKVVGHYDWFAFAGSDMKDLDYFGFSVNEGGRQRVIREKKKNVHAFCWGWYPEYGASFIQEKILLEKNLVKVTYNPYEAGYFKEALTGEQIHSGSYVYLTPKGVFVAGPR